MSGKTAMKVREGLRLDLKDTGALWSDPELDRSIERAVADLSRFLPKEEIYEESLQFTVTGEKVTMPKAANAAAVVNAQSIDVAAGGLLAISGQPDVPRPLIITIVDADNSTYGATFIITGVDRDDVAIAETFHYSRGDSKVITGKKEFKYVYEVELDEDAGSHAGDTASVGYGLYTDAWVSLANRHIKFGSDSGVTDGDDNAMTRNTDYEIDYGQGRIRAIASGGIVAEDTVTISYTKNQVSIDLSGLADFIRVERVEYPAGEIPQNFCQWDIWGRMLTVTGQGEGDEQNNLAEGKQIAVYYAAEHIPPNDYTPGTYPDFLDNTIILSAGAYALFTYALKHEHQALTDLDSSRSSLGDATTAQTAIDDALINLKKYLDNNTEEDAVGILKDITDDASELRDAIRAALEYADNYLDEVDTTDLQGAEGIMATAETYLTGATAPSAKKYLELGDDKIDVVTVGVNVGELYRGFAVTALEMVTKYENQRRDFLQSATARTNAAMGFMQAAAQRLVNLRTYIDQAAGYSYVASLFAREAEARLTQISQFITTASGYVEAAGGDLAMADRFRTEAIERRNEAWSIWRDRKQYIGDYSQASMRQLPRYSGK